MSSLQEFVKYKQKNSATSICTANASENIQTTISIGHGIYEILSIEVDTTTQYLMDATIGYKATLQTGSRETHCFGAGQVRQYQNLVLGTPRLVEGPGVIYCNTVFLEAGDYSILTVSYRRRYDLERRPTL